MLNSFQPAIEMRKRATWRRQPVRVVQSDSLGSFEPGLSLPASSAISETELAMERRLHKCRSLIRDLNVAFNEDFGASLDGESVKGFLKLVRHFEPHGAQSLGADSSGRIVATWRVGEGALSIEFLNAFRFKFAMTISEDGEATRRWGTNHLLTFLAAEPLATRFLKHC